MSASCLIQDEQNNGQRVVESKHQFSQMRCSFYDKVLLIREMDEPNTIMRSIFILSESLNIIILDIHSKISLLRHKMQLCVSIRSENIS